MSEHGTEAWQHVTFPTAFPVLFADLGAAQGVFVLAAGASTRTLFDLRYTVPGDAETAGNATFSISLRCVNA